MGYHGNSKILLPWGVPIHHVFYSVVVDPHMYTEMYDGGVFSFVVFVLCRFW